MSMLKYSSYQSIYDKPVGKIADHNRYNQNSGLRYRKSLMKVVALFVFIMITTTGMVTTFASSDHNGNESYESIIVMPGDTLWEIAVDHKPSGQDTRIYIDAIKRANKLKVSAIQAGDTLLLPNI